MANETPPIGDDVVRDLTAAIRDVSAAVGRNIETQALLVSHSRDTRRWAVGAAITALLSYVLVGGFVVHRVDAELSRSGRHKQAIADAVAAQLDVEAARLSLGEPGEAAPPTRPVVTFAQSAASEQLRGPDAGKPGIEQARGAIKTAREVVRRLKAEGGE